MARPRNKDLDTQVVIRMPKALKKDLERIAVEEDRTVAAEVRRALRAHVAAAG